MTYGDRLRRWVVVRLLPNMQRVDVARFYKYSDAEGHVQILRRINPEFDYLIVFDPQERDEG
jgi:hypothetical protein